MKVLVTGGTGFVGAHCVSALIAEGHDVAVLARDPARVAGALEPLGVRAGRCEVAPGDVLDAEAVRRALAGAEALLHAANVYSLNAADADLMHEVNVEGTRRVLGAAAELELDPVIHVSSMVALLPSDHLSNESPVGEAQGPYASSKAAGEAIARDLQAAGAPVVITNPGSVYGPHQPHMGESATLVRNILVGKTRVSIQGGFGVVDVRDVAAAHARLLRAGSGPRRYLMGGHWVALADLFRLLEEIVGHRLPRMRVPMGVALATGRLADVAQRRGIDPLGVSSAGVWILANFPRFDDSDTRRMLEVSWRPTRETLRDTVAWLHERGAVSARQAGLAAGVGWGAPEPSGTEAA
jgi:dihydroflavonol-4-reductase